jgi:hypothetical protein
MSKADNLRELHLENLSSQAQQAIRFQHHDVFTNIQVLQVRYVGDASVLINACPNLQTFCSDYPFGKLKTTFKAISGHTRLENVQLQAHRWTGKQLKGWSLNVSLRVITDTLTEICAQLKGKTKLCLWSRNTNFATSAEIHTFSNVLGGLQDITELELSLGVLRSAYEKEMATRLLTSHPTLLKMTFRSPSWTAVLGQYSKVRTENGAFISEATVIDVELRNDAPPSFQTRFLLKDSPRYER